MTTLKLTDCVKRQDRLLTSRIDNEEVMLDMDSGSYFGLNVIGSEIWQRLAKPITVADLCQQLQTEYEISKEQCETEVLGFLHEMLAGNLIQTV